MGEVTHYRDTVIRRERWVKELWFDRDLGWIGEAKGFSRGQRIQSRLDSMASHPQDAESTGISLRVTFSINIIITHLSLRLLVSK